LLLLHLLHLLHLLQLLQFYDRPRIRPANRPFRGPLVGGSGAGGVATVATVPPVRWSAGVRRACSSARMSAADCQRLRSAGRCALATCSAAVWRAAARRVSNMDCGTLMPQDTTTGRSTRQSPALSHFEFLRPAALRLGKSLSFMNPAWNDAARQ
jgi:hypothetical protein